jgi:hypothetical protein
LYKTKEEIISFTLWWYFKFPYPKCPVYDTIEGWFNIELDKFLSLIKKPDLNFIPKSLYLKDSCNFISREKAMEITKSQNFEFGIDSLNMNLIFDDKRKLYIWDITKIKCKTIDEMGRCWGDIEILNLEAETGNVINHHITSYGWIVD